MTSDADVVVLDPITARLALEVAVDQLTQPVKMDRPDGAGKAMTASLLEVVEDSVQSNDGAGSGYAAGARPPGRLQAIAWLTELDRAIGHRHRGRTRAARLRSWSAAMTAVDPETLTRAVHAAEGWVDAARSLTEPRRTLKLRGVACPQCGHETVVVEGGEGEDVLAPAMVADMRSGELWCNVAGCGGRWLVERWQGLAAHLDQQQTTDEVLGQ